MSDRDIISPCNFNTKSSRQVMRIKENNTHRLLVELINILPTEKVCKKNCMADSEGNYWWDLWNVSVKKVKQILS